MESKGQPNFLRAYLEDGKVIVECHFMMSALVKLIKGAEWVYARRAWVCPATLETLEALRGVRGAQLDGQIAAYIGADVEPSPDPIPENADELRARLPVKARLYNHQLAAAARALKVFYGEGLAR